MDLEMRTIPQFEQSVFYIPEYELSRVLEKSSPFQGSFPTKEDIISYLTKVNGSLKMREEQKDLLKEQYITAASIYIFVQPLVHLNLPLERQKLFVSIAERRPYNVRDPLEIVFEKGEDEESNTLGSLFDAHLITLEETLHLDAQAIFERSELIKNKLLQGLNYAACALQHAYSEKNHLIFIGLWNICFPLFNIAQRNETYLDLNRTLRSDHGTIHLKLPLYLAPNHPEVT